MLGLIARGYDVAQIAEQLVISLKTVRNHLEHIYLKAGVTNRTGAALFAIEHGLTGTEDGEPPHEEPADRRLWWREKEFTMRTKSVISLTTGLEDPEKVMVAYLVAVGPPSRDDPP